MQTLNVRFNCVGEYVWESVSTAGVFVGAFWMRFGCVWMRFDAFWMRFGCVSDAFRMR